MPIKLTIEGLPSEAFLRSDDRARLRDIVGHRMRRRFDRLAQQARERTARWQRFAGSYFVRQRTEPTALVFELGNSDPRFPFFEQTTRGEPRTYPPWGEGSELADWAARHGIPPFLVARKVKTFGTIGHYIMRDVWDENEADIDSTARGAVTDFMVRWLRGSAATD
jgi:hypothetical protein